VNTDLVSTTARNPFTLANIYDGDKAVNIFLQAGNLLKQLSQLH